MPGFAGHFSLSPYYIGIRRNMAEQATHTHYLTFVMKFMRYNVSKEFDSRQGQNFSGNGVGDGLIYICLIAGYKIQG